MKRLLAFVFVTAFLAAACGGGAGQPSPSGSAPASAAAKIRIGLVTDVGGLDDKSFNTLANKGRMDAQSQLGVETNVIESKEQANYVPNLTNFAQQNYDLVIGVGFLMTNSVWKVAKQFPNVKFAIIDGAPSDDSGKTENLPNVANLFFKEQEAGYLVGVIAGEMEKNKVGKATTGTACAMGGLPIPPVDHYIAGYQDALAKYNVKVLVGYSQSFTDQQKGVELGNAHIGQGCSILFQVAGASGLGYMQAAKAKGAYAIGVDADQNYVAPDTIITSALKRVDKAVFDTIKAVQSKAYKAGDNFFSASNDGVGYGTTNSAVPASAKAAADQALADIKSGKITPSDTVKK